MSPSCERCSRSRPPLPGSEYTHVSKSQASRFPPGLSPLGRVAAQETLESSHRMRDMVATRWPMREVAGLLLRSARTVMLAVTRPFGYLAFVLALAALSASAKLLGEDHELGFFAGRLNEAVRPSGR